MVSASQTKAQDFLSFFPFFGFSFFDSSFGGGDSGMADSTGAGDGWIAAGAGWAVGDAWIETAGDGLLTGEGFRAFCTRIGIAVVPASVTAPITPCTAVSLILCFKLGGSGEDPESFVIGGFKN